MVVQAYILIQTEVGKSANVASQIGQIKGVTLAEDVTELGARQEHLVRVGSTLLAAALVAGFFLLTYLPLLSSTFSQR